MLEEARQKEALRSKSVPPARKKDKELGKATKGALDKEGKVKNAKNIQLKGKLGATTEREKNVEEAKEAPKKYYVGDSKKIEVNVKTDDGQVVTKRGESYNTQQIIPSLGIEEHKKKEEEK